jgi:hypothetical protein
MPVASPRLLAFMVSFIFLFYPIAQLRAQLNSDIEDYRPFFSSIPEQYREWLGARGLAKVLDIDTVEILDNKLICRLSIPSKSNWFHLDSIVRSDGGRELESEIFDYVLLLSDLPANQIRLIVDASDAVLFVEIGETDSMLSIIIIDKMGIISDQVLVADADFSQIGRDSAQGGAELTLQEVKIRIIDTLSKFFNRRNRSWFLESQVESIASYRHNEFILRVSNIKSIVLDQNYFEYLRITFHFAQENEQIKVTYLIDGKYGPGILWTPFETDYRPMSPRYDDALTRFAAEDLKNQIFNALTK